MEALLSGQRLTRQLAAAIHGGGLAAADRQLKEIREIRGMDHQDGETFFKKALLFDPASYSSVVSACMMAGLGRLFRGTTYEQGMNAALALIIDRHPRAVDFAHLPRKFVFAEQGGETSLPEADGILDDLIQAILKQRKIQLKYSEFSGNVESTTVDPLSLVIFDHQLYALVRRPKGDFHAIRFSRIKKLVIRATGFDYPATTNYDPGRLLGEVFGIFVGMEAPMTHIEVRLDKKWTTYAETHRWHQSQTVAIEKKWITLTMQLRPCPQLEAWLMSFGPDAEVMEPQWLREKSVGQLLLLPVSIWRQTRREVVAASKVGNQFESNAHLAVGATAKERFAERLRRPRALRRVSVPPRLRHKKESFLPVVQAGTSRARALSPPAEVWPAGIQRLSIEETPRGRMRALCAQSQPP